MQAKAGEVILFDYRLKHRGLANKSTISRPLVSTASMPWFEASTHGLKQALMRFSLPGLHHLCQAVVRGQGKFRYRHKALPVTATVVETEQPRGAFEQARVGVHRCRCAPMLVCTDVGVHRC